MFIVPLTKLPIAVGKKVIIKIKKLDKMTSGGIFIPQIAEDKHRAKDGYVVALGDKCVHGLQIGDYVFFEEFVGSRLYMNINGEVDDYLFVHEDAILMAIQEDTND